MARPGRFRLRRQSDLPVSDVPRSAADRIDRGAGDSHDRGDGADPALLGGLRGLRRSLRPSPDDDRLRFPPGGSRLGVPLCANRGDASGSLRGCLCPGEHRNAVQSCSTGTSSAHRRRGEASRSDLPSARNDRRWPAGSLDRNVCGCLHHRFRHFLGLRSADQPNPHQRCRRGESREEGLGRHEVGLRRHALLASAARSPRCRRGGYAGTRRGQRAARPVHR